MAKALKPIVIILLLLSIGSLVLGIQLYSKREVLKARVQHNENALTAIAKNIRFDQFKASSLVVNDAEGLPRMQTALNQLAAGAQVQYDDLQNTKQDLETTRQDLSMAKDELARTQSDLDRSLAQIDSLNQSISEKNSQISRQETRIDGLEQEKVSLQIQIDDLNNQIVQLEDELHDSKDKILTLEQTVGDLERELGYGQTKPLPKGLTGRILYVNKAWNFVVIDLGSDDGMVQNAEMLIHREDKLVGKVSVSSIDRKMSIAELQPDWAEARVKEGDYVVY